MITTPLRGAYTSIAGLPACHDFHDELANSQSKSRTPSPHMPRVPKWSPPTHAVHQRTSPVRPVPRAAEI